MNKISSDSAAAELFHAIVGGNAHDVRHVLIKHEGIVHAPFPGQDSFLHLAAGEGNAEIVALLIEFGAFVNQVSSPSLFSTPLCNAAREGHTETARVLLHSGAWVDGDDRTSHTPLMLASRDGHDAVVELLLNSGAEVNRLGYVQRFFALDFAGWHGTDKTKALLRSQGGRSVTDEFDWESQSGYPIISHVSNEAGPVYPISFERPVADRDIALRLAYIDIKEKPLVLFTAEIHQMGVPIEVVINLPQQWPLKQTYMANGSTLSFPIDMLQRVAQLVVAGEPLAEGSVLLRDAPQFADLGWPDKLCALVAVDHDWEAASAKSRRTRSTASFDIADAASGQPMDGNAESSDDEVTILTLVPVLDGEKIPVGPALSKWLEKKRTASWVKLCLPPLNG